MDRKIIDKIAAAWQEVVEKKHKKLDPVGKADADIDNDGDVDKSDDYLHNRRKAISKAMKKESCCDKCGKDKCECEKDEACWDSHKQVGMKKKGDRMVPNCVPKEAVVHDKYGYGEILSENEDGTVDVLFDSEVQFNVPVEELSAISEKLGLPKKSGHGKSDHEGITDKEMASKSARDMLATVSKDKDDREAQSHVDATKAGRAGKPSPARGPADKLGNGDKSIVNPVKGAVTHTTGKEG